MIGKKLFTSNRTKHYNRTKIQMKRPEKPQALDRPIEMGFYINCIK